MSTRKFLESACYQINEFRRLPALTLACTKILANHALTIQRMCAQLSDTSNEVTIHFVLPISTVQPPPSRDCALWTRKCVQILCLLALHGFGRHCLSGSSFRQVPWRKFRLRPRSEKRVCCCRQAQDCKQLHWFPVTFVAAWMQGWCRLLVGPDSRVDNSRQFPLHDEEHYACMRTWGFHDTGPFPLMNYNNW